MESLRVRLYILLLFALPVPAGAVPVTFLVSVPSGTRPGATVWISGNDPALGSWNGSGLQLAPDGKGGYRGSAEFSPGAALEFKVTRGSWDTVEKDARGGEVPNRRWKAQGADTVRVRVEAWRDATEKARPHTLTGKFERRDGFPSAFVKPRDILVWLPPGYDRDTTRRYPVVYFHDGNNVFDVATSFLGVEWGADETATRLIETGRIRPFIAVGVYNTPDRVEEYTPAVTVRRGAVAGGRAAEYGRFLVEELKPWVDRRFRTLEGPGDTGMIGSSLGGLVSVYLGLEHPEVYGLIGALSPSVWWADRDILARVRGHAPRLRLWIDTGGHESGNSAERENVVAEAGQLRDSLVACGYAPGKNLHFEVFPGAEHNETAWAARLDRILEFLLPPK